LTKLLFANQTETGYADNCTVLRGKRDTAEMPYIEIKAVWSWSIIAS
jgi:hypothetical protein